MYTIIVQWRLLNIKCHFRSQATTDTWIPANAWMPRAISFCCMEIWQDEEHLLLFPSFVMRPEGRCDSCGYMCAWGGGWFASPLDYLVILYVENVTEVLWRRMQPAALWFSCSIICSQLMEAPRHASVRHYSSQTCQCWQPVWRNLNSCCIFNNYHHVIIEDECWQISTFPQIAPDKLCKTYCALSSVFVARK